MSVVCHSKKKKVTLEIAFVPGLAHFQAAATAVGVPTLHGRMFTIYLGHVSTQQNFGPQKPQQRSDSISSQRVLAHGFVSLSLDQLTLLYGYRPVISVALVGVHHRCTYECLWVHHGTSA